jgi:hypothetical protein
MVSLVTFFIDRCCGTKRRAPKACDLEFRVKSTVRRSLSKIELNHQRPVEELIPMFNKWKVLDGHQRETTIALLLDWISLNRGCKYISTYERFKQMADQLMLSSSENTEEEFWKTYDAIEQEEGGEEYQLLLLQAKAARKKAQEEAFSSFGSI